MHKGRLVAAGEVNDIVAGGGEATFRVDRVTDAARILRDLNGTSGVTADGQLVHADLGTTSRSAAVTALVNAGIAVEQAGPRRRLEDAFLRLVESND
jgi:ABC-2 type transport system ATP-binding protein